jgi:hypothetical protein
MTNINQILRNLRRKGIENQNSIACPECGWIVNADYIFDDINDGEYNLIWEHQVTRKNTNGEDVTVTEYRTYPRNDTHVPAYLEVSTWCRSTDDDGECDCEHSFKIRYHIISQEII